MQGFKQAIHFPKPKTIGQQMWPPHQAAKGPATPLRLVSCPNNYMMLRMPTVYLLNMGALKMQDIKLQDTKKLLHISVVLLW